jgi:hypothetical protein
MEISMESPRCRIVSGSPMEAEEQINRLWKDYHLLTINVQPADGKPLVTAVMLHRSEIPRSSPISIPIPKGFAQ